MDTKEDIKKALDCCNEHIKNRNSNGQAPDRCIVSARNVLQSLLNRVILLLKAIHGSQSVTVVGLVPWTVLIIAAVRVIPSDINACVRPGVGMSVWHMESRKGRIQRSTDFSKIFHNFFRHYFPAKCL